MQRFMIVLITLSFSFGCGASKKMASENATVSKPVGAETPAANMEAGNKAMEHPAVGEWEYVIKDLPDGDSKGVLSIKRDGDKYVGTIQSDQGSIPLKNLLIDHKELKKASFEAQGYAIDMSGAFEGDAFTGKISAAGYDFPMTAVRKQ